MSLFDLNPKDTPESLFGRDKDLADLVRLVDAGRWVVVLGPRMVGKTSLLKAASRRISRPSIYVNLWGARGTLGFARAFAHGLNSSGSLLTKVRGALRRIDGVSIGPGGVTVSAPRQPLRSVWDILDVIGQEAGRSVIELDEIQELTQSSGAILKILGNVFNSHPDVVFVFTGSKFGLVRTLLEPRGDSPLFGRSPASLTLSPFEPDQSVAFLEAGFKEYRRTVPRPELAAVVNRSLDGMPGWLTLFGNRVAVERLSLQEAEESTIKEAKRVIRGELSHFFNGRDRATSWAALRVLANSASWTEVRDGLSARRGTRVNDNTVKNVLGALAAAGLISEAEGRYLIPDPILRSLVMSSTRAPASEQR
jgi:uncharacterized protein